MFELTSEYGIHEGGSKYYQIFNIRNTVSGDGCVVTHWGAYRYGCPREPRLHGKAVKVDTYKRGRSTTEARQKMRGKSARGYKEWNKISNQYATVAELTERMHEMFKDGDADLIVATLTNAFNAGVPSSDEAYEADDFEDYDNAEYVKSEILKRKLRDDQLKASEEETLALMAKEKNELMQNKNWGAF